jgi:tryptophan-rich sensory protein
MTNNKKKNIALLIATAFLFAALFDGWPYGFFTLLRFVVFAISAYIAWMSYEAKKERWVWIFGFLAVLFNPFIVIRLNRETWSIIDFIVGVFMIVSVFVFKLSREVKSKI